jgi:hypothetical protein
MTKKNVVDSRKRNYNHTPTSVLFSKAKISILFELTKLLINKGNLISFFIIHLIAAGESLA